MNNHILLFALILALFSCIRENEKRQSHSEKKTRNYAQTTLIPEGITTPDVVATSIGTLHFMDGAPQRETAELLYDNLDRMRGVDIFLKCIPAASVRRLILGPGEIGANANNKALIMENLLDSKPLFLTGNTSTLYVMPNLNLKETGPVVMQVPPGMLGAFNDAWFRYVQDLGPFGPDKGLGGKYLVIPPDYKGEIPKGYFNVHPRSFRVFIFMRAFTTNGMEAAISNIKDNLKVYPLAQKDAPPAMEFINASGKSFNTIHDNNINFYYEINEVIQEEPLDLIDPETRGLLASIGIEKGKPFHPDARMKKILADAVAIGNGTARSILWYPRVNGSVDNMKGILIYPEPFSNWLTGFCDKNVFFNGKDGMTMNSDARTFFYYPATAVTPAMAVTIPGKGSDYAIAFIDANKQPLDGAQRYKLHIPPKPPVRDFWALTVYDSQTRSQLQTDQKFPSVGSQTEGLRTNEDGSMDIYFCSEAPEGFEKNWLQTIPGKSWFVVLRMYGPLESWIDKTWRPGEIEMIK